MLEKGQEMPLNNSKGRGISLEIGAVEVAGQLCHQFSFDNDVQWFMPVSLIAEHFMLEYEILERNVIYKLYGEGDTVLEAGSGLGITGLAVLRSGAKLVAYEPQEGLIEILKATFEANDFKNVPIVCAAIAPNTGQVDLSNWGISWGRSILEQVGKTTTVPCIGVNEALKMHNANALHMDVEGVECHILEVLHWNLIDKLSLEVHPSMIGDDAFEETILRRADENNFEIYCTAGMEMNYPKHNYVVGFRRKEDGT